MLAALLVLFDSSSRAAPAPLVSIEQIRAIASWDDRDNHPVAIEGVVTHVDAGRNLLVLQDATGALAFDVGDGAVAAAAVPGQRVLLSAKDCGPAMLDVPRYPNRPDKKEQLGSFESVPVEQKGFYIERFRGCLYPPVSGQYHFAIASDDTSQLFLGSDGSPATRKLIAQVQSYTRQRDWGRTAPQRSESIFLEAGRAYYIEAIHQQTGGLVHLSVAWQGPDRALEVIDGKYLGPWGSAVAQKGDVVEGQSHADSHRGSILREVWNDATIDNLEQLAVPKVLGSMLSVANPVVTVLGAGRLPEPVMVRPGQVLGAGDDFCWSELEGMVDFVACDGGRLTLEISDGGTRVQVVVSGWHADAPANMRGRTIRVVGVAECVWQNAEKRRVGRIWAQASGVSTLANQTPRLDLARLTTISELAYGDPNSFRDAAVKFTGKVVSHEGNKLTLTDSGTFAAFVSNDGREWRAVGTPIEVAMGPKVYAGLAVNSRVPAKSSQAVFADVTGLSRLPQLIDIGNPGLSGRFAVEANRYAVDGVGSDIWDSPDQFTFVYDTLEGAGSIVARLENFSPADPAARAGLMIRESLTAPDAQFVDLIQTQEQGVPSTCLQWRWLMAGSSTRTVSDALPAALPLWLKLERRFSTATVNTSEAAYFAPGENVDAVGFVATTQGHPVIVNATVTRRLQDSPVLAVQSSWRPLVEIARLGDGNGKWGGLDFFRIRGVVTFCGDVLGRRYWAIQDQSAAALLTGRDASNLFKVSPGSFVEIVSNPGWAPPTNTLFADNVFTLGPATLPKPVLHPAEYLLPKRGEGTWIELEGVVRAVADSGIMEIKTRGEVFAVAVSDARTERLRSLVDAEVRLRGVIVYPNERERLLLVPSADHLEIARTPPPDPFTAAIEPAGALTVESLLNQSRHRTRLRGTVTFADKATVCAQDESGGFRAELASPMAVAVGSVVELAGFPDWGEDDCVVLRHALMQVKAAGAGVTPVLASPLEMAGGNYANKLVQIRGTLAREFDSTDGELMELSADRRYFGLALAGQFSPVGKIPRGSVVEITGVSIKTAKPLQPDRADNLLSSVLPLKLLVRGPSDIVVLQKPSWWVVKRALIVASFIGVIAVIGSVWIHVLRRRVRQRTAELNATMEKLQKEARMSATLAERDRLAGEIHDSLEQGLNGLLLQLQGTANLDSCPPEIRSSLKLACNMASFSRTEVQNAVWELQSPMLEDSELPVAIEKIMRQITPESLRGTVNVEGSQRRLPSAVEHHLLRIAQEALNNTVKHAAARNVDVLLRYEADAVTLSVTDDGCGFDPGQVRTGGLGHFGLRSLRSRAGKIRATHEIVSFPGKGTTIRIRVPDVIS